eukprot:6208307-Pleurochrysis_carterae.AAC.1
MNHSYVSIHVAFNHAKVLDMCLFLETAASPVAVIRARPLRRRKAAVPEPAQRSHAQRVLRL